MGVAAGVVDGVGELVFDALGGLGCTVVSLVGRRVFGVGAVECWETNFVLNGAGYGGLGCVGGTLALLVGETGRHIGDVLVVRFVWFGCLNVVVIVTEVL